MGKETLIAIANIYARPKMRQGVELVAKIQEMSAHADKAKDMCNTIYTITTPLVPRTGKQDPHKWDAQVGNTDDLMMTRKNTYLLTAKFSWRV